MDKIFIDINTNEPITLNQTKFAFLVKQEENKYYFDNVMSLKDLRIAEITTRLEQLDKDFRQADLGAVIEDLDERKAEFITLHNELRTLQGKPLRVYEV